MAVPKRKSEYLGLKNVDVLIRDTSYESDYFNVIECPSVLTQGKSSFLIAGSDRLKAGVDIKMELVNNQTQEAIYLQPIEGHLEGNSRRVTVEVYEDVTPGQHTLYILGEIDPNWYSENIGGTIPSEWSDIYNVRWSKSVSVNAGAVNTQPIFFYKQPTISITEKFKEFVNVPSSSAVPIYLSGSGEPRDGIPTIVPTENATDGGFGESTYPALDFANKAKESIIEENKAITKLRGTGGALSSKGKLVQTMSPVPDDYLISVTGDSTVDSLYVGNKFHINNPSVDTTKFTLQSYHSVPTIYSSSIMKVINNKTFVPKDNFYVNDNRTSPPTLVPAPFSRTWPITSSYYELGTQTTSSINFFSFADITVGDLKTFSGDVHKLKVFARSEGSLGDFELIYDSPLESSQILFDKTESTTLNNMGYFLDVARINKYWDIYDGTNGLNVSSPGFKYDSSVKIDSMHITGSNYGVDDSIRVEHTNVVDFLKGTLYNFKAKIYGKKSLKQKIDGSEESQASFKVYTFGDAFEGDTTEGPHWGFEKLSIPDFPTGVTEYDFGTVEGSFLADNTGTGRIQFRVDSGEWYVSDIQVKTATETAFNPESVNVTTPLPPLMNRPDNVRFLVEFYDVNNNIADSVVFSQPFQFKGANTTVGGEDNIISGSMFIGSALASGVEMAGVNSAFIRSMGYKGFSSASNADGDNSGFLFFSGSVLPDSGDDYKGVGLELVGHSGSYFKFGTSPSELDIRTDKFFIGNESIQFISGSDGNIEISSSLFHLDPVNDLLVIGADAVINADLTVDNIRTPAIVNGSPATFANASASITSQGNVSFKSGSIAGWKIFGNILSGSNVSLDSQGAALFKSDQGPDTDDSAAFDIQRDEYYIDFTPSDQGNTTNYFVKFGPNFAVDSDGVLIASGAVFEGQITASTGLIGGASIESASLAYSPFWRISSSAAQTDPVSFISSSRFKVSAGGNITGSQVLFTGGQIAGWDINSTNLTSPGDGIKLNANGDNSEISVNSHTFGNEGIQLGFNGGSPRFYVGDGSQNFFKYTTSGGVDIKTLKFELDTTNVEISSTNASMSLGEGKLVLQGSSTPFIAVNSGSDNQILIKTDGTDSFMTMGNKTSFTDYDKSTIGIIVGMDDDIPKIELAKDERDYLRWDATDGLDLRTTKMEVSASNVQISSTQASMSIGDPTSTGGAIVLQSQGTDKMLKFGDKTTFDQTTTAGLIMGINGDTSNDPEFDYTAGTDNSQYIRMLTSGIDIKVPNFKLDTDRLDIDSANSRIDIYDASGGTDGSDLRVRIGEVDPTTANHYGMVIYDGTGSGSADEIVHFSDVKYQISSWSLSPTQITSANLVIDSAGVIQTSDFASGVKGWRITSANNGEAEFEKVTVRGTLATTVFEKESVNAVGGQLYVANSTIYTSSLQLSATDTTMSVANVGGFTSGEILSAKKISDTGFKTEYMFVNSASRDNPSSEKDFSGKLYLVRGYSGSLPGTQSTASLGDSAQASQTYESGQVIVSTGKVGTGYVRINANPNDSTTPYIDIVERTGSAIYDIALKARLGDLSGLSSGLLYGEANPGFGLFTENVFLQGGITAVTGSITGKLHVRTDALNQLVLGTNVQSTNDGIYLNDNNYWYTNDKFRIGDTNNYFEWDSSTLTIKPQTLEINAGSGDFQISSTHKSMSFGDGDILLHSPNSSISTMRLGSVTTKAIFMTGSSTVGAIRSGKTSASDTTEGFWIANNNADAEFVVGDGTDFIKFDNNELEVTTRKFELDAGGGDVQISTTHASMSLGNKKIVLKGDTNPFIVINSGSANDIKLKTDGTDAFMTMGNKDSFSDEGSGTAGILIGMDGSNPQAEFVKSATDYFIFDNGLDIKTTKFELDASNVEISSTHASMSLGEGKLVLQGSSTPFIALNSGSANDIKLKTDGTDAFITMHNKNSFSDEGSGTAGIIIGMDGGNPQAEFVKSATDYFIFDSGLDIKTPKFELDANNLELSSTHASMSLGEGKIILQGGSTSTIKVADKFIISGDGTDEFLAIGNKTSFSHFDQITSGVIMGMHGSTSKFEVVGDTDNYFSFNGSGLDIKAETFGLKTSTMIVSSSLNNGTIRLGASQGPSSVTSDTAGIYMDGSGDFQIYGDADNYLRFDISDQLQIAAETFDLKTPNLRASSSFGGTISMGVTPPTTPTSGTGAFISGSGDVMFGNSSGNRLQFVGGAVVLQSNTFSLDATTIVIDSSANDGKIALGASPNTSVAGTNAGIYMDGTGDFLARGNANNFIKKDGTSLSMSSETFDLNAGSGKLILESATPSLTLNDSNAFLRIGGLTSIDSGSTARGVYMEGDGDILFKASSSAHTDYLKFTNDGLELKTSTLTFTTDGNIESQDFLVERSRLFGAGEDGSATLTTGTGQSSLGGGLIDSHNSTANLWTLLADVYLENLTVNSSVTLKTAGFRIFVKDTLINNGDINNSGTDGSGQNGEGIGGVGGTMSAGVNGVHGGAGGTGGGSGARAGGDGGSSGGAGGIVLIFARHIINAGTIRSNGGDGADGGDAKAVQP